MTPAQLSEQLRKIASAIDRSSNPSKVKVASALKGVLNRVADHPSFPINVGPGVDILEVNVVPFAILGYPSVRVGLSIDDEEFTARILFSLNDDKFQLNLFDSSNKEVERTNFSDGHDKELSGRILNDGKLMDLILNSKSKSNIEHGDGHNYQKLPKGKWHHNDGPAVEHPNETKEWYKNGKKSVPSSDSYGEDV